MGKFRVLLGALLFFVLDLPPLAQPVELHRNYSWLADWDLVHRVASSQLACDVLSQLTFALCALFTVGLWTKQVYVLLVGSVIFCRLVDLQRIGTHDWDLPILTLLALLVVPWGDGFSLDAWRRKSDQNIAGRRYGLAIWIPGLTIGLALLAAAYAKLGTSGVAWVTTGAVKFHFIEHAFDTPYRLGLWVASQPTLAVLLSAVALTTEAMFIAVTLISSPWIRMLVAGAGLSLFAGFYVFQGVIWRPWLIFFTAFLPWPLLDKGVAPASTTARLTPLHAVVVAVIVAQQVFASVTTTQVEPIVSNYPMYSGTYLSAEAFDRRMNQRFQRLFFESNGEEISERVRAIDGQGVAVVEAARNIAAGHAPSEGALAELRAFRAKYETQFKTVLNDVTVTAERVSFDWDAGEFRAPVRVRIADVALPAL